MTARRIYCETLPYDVLVARRSLSLLRRYELSLVLAVRPWQLEELPRVTKILAEAGIAVSLWPMLADDEGRWANVDNAEAFARLVRALVRKLEPTTHGLGEVLIDLEPAFPSAPQDRPARAWVESATLFARDLVRPRALGAPDAPVSYEAGARTLRALVDELRERGIATTSAVWPLTVLDTPRSQPWQRLLGTPVTALETSRVSVMAYTTIFEGWSRGLVRRADALALLGTIGAWTAELGPRWGLSLGCVGTGAFEDEPTYTSPFELAQDVAVAIASGCHDLSLFDLAGVLSRPPAEAWLDAFVRAPESSIAPLRTARAASAAMVARVATSTLARASSRPSLLRALGRVSSVLRP